MKWTAQIYAANAKKHLPTRAVANVTMKIADWQTVANTDGLPVTLKSAALAIVEEYESLFARPA